MSALRGYYKLSRLSATFIMANEENSGEKIFFRALYSEVDGAEGRRIVQNNYSEASSLAIRFWISHLLVEEHDE